LSSHIPLSLTNSGSKIILVLLSSGEAYLVDLRKEHRGRYELVEMLAEPENDEEAEASRARCA
jgi:COMPASS component SWD1